jgi:hypothetical protein
VPACQSRSRPWVRRRRRARHGWQARQVCVTRPQPAWHLCGSDCECSRSSTLLAWQSHSDRHSQRRRRRPCLALLQPADFCSTRLDAAQSSLVQPSPVYSLPLPVPVPVPVPVPYPSPHLTTSSRSRLIYIGPAPLKHLLHKGRGCAVGDLSGARIHSNLPVAYAGWGRCLCLFFSSLPFSTWSPQNRVTAARPPSPRYLICPHAPLTASASASFFHSRPDNASNMNLSVCIPINFGTLSNCCTPAS